MIVILQQVFSLFPEIIRRNIEARLFLVVNKMIPDKEQFEEFCAAYALGALEEEERALFEEGLHNGGEDYKKIFAESIGVAYLLNSSVKKEIPSSSIKAMLKITNYGI